MMDGACLPCPTGTMDEKRRTEKRARKGVPTPGPAGQGTRKLHRHRHTRNFKKKNYSKWALA